MLDKDVVNLIHYLLYEIRYDPQQIRDFFGGRGLTEIFDCSRDTTPDYDAGPYLHGDELSQQLRNFINDVDAQLATPPKSDFMFGFPLRGEKPRKPGAKRPAFLAMPFEEPFLSQVAPLVTERARRRGFECTSLVDEKQPGSIIGQIWQRIRSSDVVVADLTSHNPNVMYELGVAHALGKPSIIIMQRGHERPFDLGVDRCCKYDLEDLDALGAWIEGAFGEVPWRYGFDRNAGERA